MARGTVRILAFAAALVLILQLVGVAALARYREQVSEVFALPAAPPEPESVRIDTPTEAEVAAFQEAVEGVGQALELEDGAAAARHFDTERMLEEIVRGGIRKTPAAKDRASVLRTLQQGVDRSLLASKLRWDKVFLRRVRFLNDEHTEAMIFTRVRGVRGNRHKLRWWIRHGVNGWRFYDVENLNLGLRLTLTTGQVTLASKARERDALMRLSNAALALQAQNADDTERILARFEDEPLSAPGQAYRWQLRANLALVKGNAAETLECIDKAEALQPHPYSDVVRAAAHNMLGEHEKAMEVGRRAIQIGGDDAFTYWQIGMAAEKLGLRDEAVEAYRAGLQEEPTVVRNLHGLRAVLPAGKKAELGEWLAKMQSPRGEFNTLVTEAMNDRDEESVDVLVDAIRKIAPGDPAPDFVKARLNIRRKKVNIGIAQFKIAIKKVANEDDRKEQVLLFLDDMLAAGKSVEAYRAAPDPTLAFVYLAGKLEGKAERADELARLVAEQERKQKAP